MSRATFTPTTRFGAGAFPRSVAFAVEFARTVEAHGYEKLWITDSHQLYADPYVALTACASATDDLEVSPGVTNPVTRHPTVTADAIAGPADECRERVERLAARGVDECFLGFPATDPLGHAERFAEQVADRVAG